MKTAQYVLMKFICFLMLLVGIFFFAFGLQQTAGQVQEFILGPIWRQYAEWVGLGLIVLSILALIPILKRHPGNVISVPGIYGDVIIHLDSIEAILKRIIGKTPEIRRVRVHLIASEDRRRAQVKALVWIRKGVDTGARDIRDRIESLLHDSVFHILGVEEVASVNLEIMGIIPVPPTVPTPVAPPDPTDQSDPSDPIPPITPIPEPPTEQKDDTQQPC